jgi:hypothetical protein
MKKLTYQEATTLIENFMINSGIRDYCTKICKGDCCSKCYDSPDACRHHEGRRLLCSIFICTALYMLLPKKESKKLRIIDDNISNVYEKIYAKLYPTTYIPNFYFWPPSDKFLKHVRFPAKLIRDVTEIDIVKIKTITDDLIARKDNIRRG